MDFKTLERILSKERLNPYLVKHSDLTLFFKDIFKLDKTLKEEKSKIM